MHLWVYMQPVCNLENCMLSSRHNYCNSSYYNIYHMRMYNQPNVVYLELSGTLIFFPSCWALITEASTSTEPLLICKICNKNYQRSITQKYLIYRYKITPLAGIICKGRYANLQENCRSSRYVVLKVSLIHCQENYGYMGTYNHLQGSLC